MSERIRLFLSAPHPPALLARGLYAGLKSRNGLPTPLPVVLGADLYVNAGFIDGLSAPLTRSLGLTEVQLRLVARGPVLLQWYYLDRHGAIRHYTDQVAGAASASASASAQHDLPVPSVLLTDENIRLIFFRISHDSDCRLTDSSQLMDWCFHAEHSIPEAIDPLLLVSRSLAESSHLIKQHHHHHCHHADLRKRFPDLHFMPMPHLHLYESDLEAYQHSRQLLQEFNAAHRELPVSVSLYRNPFNLGGGGNMCLAVKRSVVEAAHVGDFVMLDSDTLVPFKTLYTSALISALSMNAHGAAAVLSPVVAYRKRPTMVLEAGGLFGRGVWELATSTALQPCISPLEHGADLSDKHVQARLTTSRGSEYPPFIFSLYRLGRHVHANSLLPAPFFLRGDDVEYGFYLRNLGIKTSVLGSLLVFQDPKHSPWHEVMAILHSTVILIAYAKPEDLDLLGEHLCTYFDARLNAHSSVRDLHGISIYQQVLSRLLSLMSVPEDDLHTHFYDPDYYLGLRNINSPYTELNYKMACAIASSMPEQAYREMPFLYYPPLQKSEQLPDSVILVNHLAETAAVLHPSQVSCSELHAACLRYKQDLASLAISLDVLRHICLSLLDRRLIANNYDSYSCDQPTSPMPQRPAQSNLCMS